MTRWDTLFGMVPVLTQSGTGLERAGGSIETKRTAYSNSTPVDMKGSSDAFSGIRIDLALLLKRNTRGSYIEAGRRRVAAARDDSYVPWPPNATSRDSRWRRPSYGNVNAPTGIFSLNAAKGV